MTNSERIIGVLEKIDDKIYSVEKLFLCILLLTMALLAFSTVILQLFFKICFVGCEDIIQNMVLWCTFIGGSIGARGNRHLNINILQTYLKKENIMKLIEILLFVAVCVVGAFLAWSGYRFILSQYEFGEDLPSLGMKLWIFQVILPYVYAMLVFRYFIGALKRITGRD